MQTETTTSLCLRESSQNKNETHIHTQPNNKRSRYETVYINSWIKASNIQQYNATKSERTKEKIKFAMATIILIELKTNEQKTQELGNAILIYILTFIFIYELNISLSQFRFIWTVHNLTGSAPSRIAFLFRACSLVQSFYCFFHFTTSPRIY